MASQNEARSAKVPASIGRIAHASIAMLWKSHEEAVNTIFVGKDRQYDRRSPYMCSHHLVNPIGRTRA
jgi:hypothetical protein